MPIVVVFDNGQRELFEGQSIKSFWESGWGDKVLARDLEGHDACVIKGKIRSMRAILDSIWNAKVEEQKKEAEDQAKSEADRRAKEEETARLAAIEARKLGNRVKRVFRLK